MKKVNYVNKTTSKKQSIIIALITAVLCLVIIAVSGIYTASDTNLNEDISTVSYENEIDDTKVEAESIKNETERKTAKVPATEAKAIAAEPANKNFEPKMPIKYEEREIQKIFSTDALMYSVTMNDYRIHTGLDIACPINTHVYASCDGVVTYAGEDAFMGYTIEIEHSDGYKTVYSNLSSVDMVEVGQSLKSGELIATTGQSASAEMLDAPHIHFEILKNGEHINPLDKIQ